MNNISVNMDSDVLIDGVKINKEANLCLIKILNFLKDKVVLSNLPAAKQAQFIEYILKLSKCADKEHVHEIEQDYTADQTIVLNMLLKATQQLQPQH
ncbi:hypothetical protein ACT7SV_001183 [Vibrio cholerae]